MCFEAVADDRQLYDAAQHNVRHTSGNNLKIRLRSHISLQNN